MGDIGYRVRGDDDGGVFGGALGFYLLFGIPLPLAGLLTAGVTFGIIYMQRFGQKVVEIIIAAFIAVICAAYAIEMFLAQPDWSAVALHAILPSLPDGQAVLLPQACWARQ